MTRPTVFINSPRLFVDPSMSESNSPYRSLKYCFVLVYPIGRNATQISMKAVSSIAESRRDARGAATEDCRNSKITNPGNEQRVSLSHEASARTHSRAGFNPGTASM